MAWKTETVISGLAVGVALFALLVSIRSCQQAEQSLSMQKKEFSGSRSAVWKLGAFKDSTVELASVSDEIKLQKAFVYYPPGFGIAASPVKSPDYRLSQSAAAKALRIGISQIEPRHRAKILGPVGAVPVVIESWYVAKGSSFRDVAVYSLEFSSRPPTDSSGLTISGLSFARRLNPEDNIRNVLAQEWKKYLSL